MKNPKPYVITTGVIFGLITLAHIWRIAAERPVAADPWFLSLTGIAAGLAFWAFALLRGSPHR